MYDISTFLHENYGGTRDIVVTVFEVAEPYYLIGASTGINPYQEVLASNEGLSCPEATDDECVTVRVPANEMDQWNHSASELNRIASLAADAQAVLGFPSSEIAVKTGDIFSKSYISRSIMYRGPGTSLDWVVVVSSPMVRETSDTIQAGDASFITLILMAVAGSLACAIMFTLWYRNREKRAVKHGDFVFTSAFILGCILLNLSSLVALGENTNAMCMARFWTFNLSFSLAIAPLLAKVYRVYLLVGGRGFKRRGVTHKQAALYTLPIIAMEVVILLVFTFVDPPRTVEDINFDSAVPVHSIVCKHETDAAQYTELAFNSALVGAGCILSYLSRDLDSRFGEAKQLIFGMYNIAVTGLCLIFLLSFLDVSPAAIHMFRAIGIFWGTVLTCAVFVFPRLMQAWNPLGPGRSSSIRLSGMGDLTGQLSASAQFSAKPIRSPSSPAGSQSLELGSQAQQVKKEESTTSSLVLNEAAKEVVECPVLTMAAGVGSDVKMGLSSLEEDDLLAKDS